MENQCEFDRKMSYLSKEHFSAEMQHNGSEDARERIISWPQRALSRQMAVRKKNQISIHNKRSLAYLTQINSKHKEPQYFWYATALVSEEKPRGKSH